MNKTGNIVETVLHYAEERGDQLALVIPTKWDDAQVQDDERITFRHFAVKMKQLMAGFRAQGLVPGDRVVVLFPLCIDLYVSIAALYACGLTAVLIEPGMGAKRIKWSLQTVGARGIVSVHAFLKYRWLLSPLRRIPLKFSRDSSGFGVRPFSVLLGDSEDAPPLLHRAPDDEALITFTSGSTGNPKGANRTHGHLFNQREALKSTFPPFLNQVDMTCLPVVAFHNLSCGIPTILPAVDLAAPASVSPGPVVSQLKEWKVSSLTSAPAFMGRLTSHLLETNDTIDTLKLVGVGGAPVSKGLAGAMIRAFPNAKGYAVYGSTEAEPMAHAALKDVVHRDSDGFLGGEIVEVAEVALVNLPTPPPSLGPEGLTPYCVAPGDTGEVVVRGSHVNRGYINNPEADRENKLHDANGTVWHRTGDLGYFDPDGLLWLVGRLKDRVTHGDGFIDPYPLEAALEALGEVRRAALIQSPKSQDAVLVLEGEPGASNGRLLERANEVLGMRDLRGLKTLLTPAIPVDGRHNSKIDRIKLKAAINKQWPLSSGELTPPS